MSTPDAVIDTNVFISAQRSKRGASSKLVSLIGTGRFEIHASAPLVFEYEDVLLRQRSELNVEVPNSLRSQIEKMAEKEGVPVSQFMAIAAAEKIASLDAKSYIEERAKRGSREKLLRVLAKAPDVEPEEYDRL